MTPISAKNILMHELIGRDVAVIRDANPSNVSVHGVVVGETRNTLLILQDGETKRIAKKTSLLRFKLPNCTHVEVEGSALVGRPEDRVKRRAKRSW